MGKRFFLLFVSPVLVVSLFVLYDRTVSGDPDHQEAQTIAEVRNAILSIYVESPDEEQLLEGALRGMVGTLDNYSAYLDRERFADMRIDTEGKLSGVGIEISIRNGWLTVITPIEGGPAYEAGVFAGDRITRIDGESSEGITINEAVQKIRGPAGSQVLLHIHSIGDTEEREVTLTRAVIQLKSVKRVGFVDESARIGYIAVVGFQQRTTQEVRKAIQRLEGEGLESLILDLRNNPGGLLDQAIRLSDLFLSDGIIVTTRGRVRDANQQYEATAEETITPYPLVLLVNEGTASASEIVAGALQDHRRAVLVGTRTFGKGSVQSIIELRGNVTGLKLTTARYYTPAGRSIHRDAEGNGGILPDLLVPMSQDQVRAMIEHQREQEIVHPEGERSRPERHLDPQLRRAIECLKGRPGSRSLLPPDGSDE